MRKFRWCKENPAHYNPPWHDFCGLDGADFVLPSPILDGRLIRPCPHCDTQNVVHVDRVGRRGVCEGCGRLLSICSQDGSLVPTDGSAAACPRCGGAYIIPPPDTWSQPGAGPTRPASTPERLFAETTMLVPAWRDFLGFHNPVTGVWYQVSAPVVTRDLILLQDSNREMHGVHLESGCPWEPEYTALAVGGPRSAPAVAGEFVYLSGLPGRLVAYATGRIGQEAAQPGVAPLPDYGIDLPGVRQSAWDAFRPPAANEAAGIVVCLWQALNAPDAYRITCTTLTCGGARGDEQGHEYPDDAWLWDSPLEAQPIGQPIVTDGRAVYLALVPDLVCRFEPDSGRRLTARLGDVEIRDGGLYAAGQDLLVVNTTDGRLVALHGSTLEEVWRWRPANTRAELRGPGCYVAGGGADGQDEIWAVDLDGRAEAVRAADGLSAAWFPHLERGRMVTADPSATADALLIPMGSDLILVRSGDGGRRAVCVVVAHVPPAMGRIVHQVAVAHERVVIATDQGRMMAYQVPGTAP